MADEKPKKKWIKSMVKPEAEAETADESVGAYSKKRDSTHQDQSSKSLLALHHGTKKHSSSKHIMKSFYGHKE